MVSTGPRSCIASKTDNGPLIALCFAISFFFFEKKKKEFSAWRLSQLERISFLAVLYKSVIEMGEKIKKLKIRMHVEDICPAKCVKRSLFDADFTLILVSIQSNILGLLASFLNQQEKNAFNFIYVRGRSSQKQR